MHKKKIAFKTWSHLGDYAVVTAVLHNAKLMYPDIEFTIDSRGKYDDLYLHNPYYSPSSNYDYWVGIEYAPEERGSERTCKYGTLCQGAVRAGLISLERKLGKGLDTQHRLVPEFFLTEEEKHKYDYLGDYIVINAGFQNKYATKGYPYYQDIVDHRPDIKFVQMGCNGSDDVHKPLTGVMNLTGQTTVRDLVCLIYSSKGLVSPPSGCVNIAGGFPHVPVHCIIGGRELPRITGYPNVRHYQSTICEGYGINRGCMLRRCSNTDGGFSRCMADVCPEDIAESL